MARGRSSVRCKPCDRPRSLLQAQVNQARSAYSVTIASEAVAAANVIELQAGPTPEADRAG